MRQNFDQRRTANPRGSQNFSDMDRYEDSGRRGEFARGTGFPHSSRQFSKQNDRGPSFAGRGPKSYHRSDAAIEEELCECLTDDPDIDATEIEVKVSEGCVKFTGSVPNSWMKYECDALAEEIRGVNQVDNNLSIRNQWSDSSKHDAGSQTNKSKSKEGESKK